MVWNGILHREIRRIINPPAVQKIHLLGTCAASTYKLDVVRAAMGWKSLTRNVTVEIPVIAALCNDFQLGFNKGTFAQNLPSQASDLEGILLNTPVVTV